jgi:hypothetical protein
MCRYGKAFADYGPANDGFRDQLLALQWVQDNIPAFGGHRSKVSSSSRRLQLTPRDRIRRERWCNFCLTPSPQQRKLEPLPWFQE